MQDSVRKWLDKLFGQQGSKGVAPVKSPRKFGKHQGSKRGFKHAHNPVWKTGLSGITPAQYRQNHMGLTPQKRRKIEATNKV